ncbi:MAG: hypothetical protein GKS05_05150 [Nitrospirales bacterium]|nr:hypothetical protein [Nitrospirales bacterium]
MTHVNQGFPKAIKCLLMLMLCLIFMGLSGCGSVGPLIAPEDIGIEKKLRQEQNQSKVRPQDPQLVPLDENEVELPPLRPIGTR